MRRRHEKRTESLGSHVVQVADDLVWRELLVLLLGCADVAREEFGGSPDVGGLLRQENGRADTRDDDACSNRKSHDLKACRVWMLR